jgi:hypothetical protein
VAEDHAMIHVRRVVLLALTAAGLTGCQSGGHFSILGYTTRPNYDEGIRTVYVPVFENQTFYRHLEWSLTKAVIREVETKTPYKVVSDRCRADTELSGAIVTVTKNILNRNQLNEVREGEQVVTVGLVWRDLRTGEVLSKPRRTPSVYPTPGIPALEIPDVGGVPPPPGPAAPADAPPVLVTGVGTFIPELGESTTTGFQEAINRLAVQIVSQMEKPW